MPAAAAKPAPASDVVPEAGSCRVIPAASADIASTARGMSGTPSKSARRKARALVSFMQVLLSMTTALPEAA